MKSKLLRSQQMLKSSIWLFTISSLLISCLQKKDNVALQFEEQEGQIAVSTKDYAITFVDNEVAIELPSGQTVAAMNFGTSTPTLSDNKVVYEDIAQQADLIFYDKGNGHAGYDIRLRPRANLEEVKLQLEDPAILTSEGELAIRVEGGEIRHSQPYAYQEIEGEKIKVESRFALAEGILSFEVDAYNRDYELVIDPEITFVEAQMLQVAGTCFDNGTSADAGDDVIEWVGDPSSGVGGCGINANGTYFADVVAGDGSTTSTGEQLWVVSGGMESVVTLGNSTSGANQTFRIRGPNGAGGTIGTGNKWIRFVNSSFTANCWVEVIDPGAPCSANAPTPSSDDIPVVGIPCYVNGAAASSTTDDEAFVLVKYDPGMGTSSLGGNSDIFKLATDDQIGTTWGVAFNQTTGSFFASATIKRHSELGPGGTGAIYRITGELDVNDNIINNTVSELIDLNDNASINTGPAPINRGLGAGNAPSADADAYNKVGRIGIGDLDLLPDNQTLVAININTFGGNTPQLVFIDISDESNATVTKIVDIDATTTSTTCTGGILVPWGIGIDESTSDIYIGAVSNGQSGVRADMFGYVYKFDATTDTFDEVLEISLDYGRSNPAVGGNVFADWQTWRNDNTYSPRVVDGFFDVDPQPIVADIEFLDNGEMMVGFIDRFGFQTGSSQFKPDGTPAPGNLGGSSAERGRPAGGLLRFSPDGANPGRWLVPADNALCSYSDVASAPENEATLGGIAYLSNEGLNEILAPTVDPTNGNSNGLVVLDLSLVKPNYPINAGTGSTYQLDVQDLLITPPGGTNPETIEKGQGLGDLELGIFNPTCLITDASLTPTSSSTFDLTVTQGQTGTGYMVSVPNGFSVNPTSGTYGMSESFTVTPALAIGQSITITVTDNDVSNCMATAVFENAAPVCDLSIAANGVTIGSCVANSFDVVVNLNWANAPITGSFEYSSDDGTTFTTLARSNMSASATGEMITISGLTCEVTKKIILRFEDETTCFNEVIFVFPPVDPAGYIYCTETGEVISGGTVSVAIPPGGMFQFLTDGVGLLDGSTGRYAWIITGSPAVAGIYTMSYTPPAGYVFDASTAGNQTGDTDDIMDPTGGSEDNPTSADPLLLGSSVNGAGTMMNDFTLANNPYFLAFDLAFDDPFVELNNLPLTGCTVSDPCTSGDLGGVVFKDVNNNGIEDMTESGQIGITIEIYACDNDTPIATTTTDINGDWSVDDDAFTYPVRVEFVIPNGSNLDPSAAGIDNGTNVQFVDASSCDVDFGVIEASSCDFSGQLLQNGYSVVACKPGVTGANSSTLTATLAIKDITGTGVLHDTPANHNTRQTVPTTFTLVPSDFNIGGVGDQEVFSIAFNSVSGNIFTGSTRLYGGPTDAAATAADMTAGSAIVYGIDGSTGAVSVLTNLTAIIGNTENFGIGYLDYNEARNELYVVGMGTGAIYRIDASTGTILQTYNPDIDPLITELGTADGLAPLGERILGLAYNSVENRIYYSVWLTDQIGFSSNTFNPIRSVGVNSTTGVIDGITDQQEFVTPELVRTNTFNNSMTPQGYNMPVGDIEFDKTGTTMLLAELGFDSSTPRTTAHRTRVLEYSGGTGSWVAAAIDKYGVGIEPGDGTTDNARGGVSFAYHDVMGGTANGVEDYVIATGDVLIFSFVTNEYVYGYQFTPSSGGDRLNSILYDLTGAADEFGKGLFGDVDVRMCEANTPAIQVGNYVWNDTDQDGVQDACEDEIPNLIVKLYDDAGLLIGQDTTDAMGEYYFDVSNVDTLGITVDGAGQATPNTAFVGLNNGEKYFIAFMGDSYDDTNDQITANGTMYNLTTADSGEGNNPDQNDSDVSEMTVPGGIGDMPVIMFVADSTDHSLDAGLIENDPILGAIGNYVWLDENSDGLQDAGEPGIPNVRVILKDDMGNPIDSTVTDSDGGYLFPDLPEAMYFVDVDETTLPNTDGNGATQDLTQTTIFTNVVDGSDADTDNDDGDFGNKDHAGMGYKITLDSGEENLTADFGYNHNPTEDVNNPMGSPVGALGDRVWYDANQDGVQDPEEAGVEGVQIKLIAASEVTIGGMMFAAGDQIATDTTDANGNYLFDGLPAGAYNVMVADDANGTGTGGPLDGYMQTGDPDHFATSEADNPDDTVEDDNMTTKSVVLGPGDVFLNVDFGYDNDAVLGSIGDYVWLDADADKNGPNAVGATGTPVNQGAGGADDSAEQPIEGVSVALIKDTNGDGKWDSGEPIIATDVTDASGLYYFPALPTGMNADYLVLVTDTDNILEGLKPTYDGDNNNESLPTDNFPSGQMANMELGLSAVMDLGTTPVLNQDFGYTPDDQDAGEGLIGDYVWYDTNNDGVQDNEESGIEEVTVYLFDLGADEMIGGGDDTLIDSTKTDENGYYYFGGLPVDADGESYQVKVAESGASNNFSAGAPLEGLVNTSDPDNGAIAPNDNMGGAVSLMTVTPVNLDQDFGYVGDPLQTVGSIGNKIFEDTNSNGVRDAGEMGFNGVTVDLYRDLNSNGELDPGEPKIGTTTTATAMGDDGMYLFENLPLDSFIVDVTDVDGVLAGYWHSDGNQDPSTNVIGNTADDANGGTSGDNSKTDAFSVGIGLGGAAQNNLNVDFGYYKDPAAAGNYVWIDTDGNGLQNDGETGLNGVAVMLEIIYPDGTVVNVMDTTRNDAMGNPGFYEFTNLLLDEDYNGDGMGAEPMDTISVDGNQAIFTSMNLVPTATDVNSNGNDKEDSDNFNGVAAQPVQGNERTAALDPETNEDSVASYDFGVTEELELCDNNDVCSYTADFETDDMGNPIVAGVTNVFVDQPYANIYGNGAGLRFSSDDQINNPVNLYNTDGMSGNDPDLERNSEGTGQWADGNIITEMLGNVLIINEDTDISDPDDNANGGQIIVDSDLPLSRFAFDMVDLDLPLQGDVIYENTATGQSFTIPFEDFEQGSGSPFEVQGVRFGDRTANRVISVTADKLGMLSFNKVTFDLAAESGAIGVLCVTVNQKELGAIGNYVWIDENSDGLQDAGEPGIPNVAVILKDGMGNPLDTTYTDSEGDYLFPDLPAGDYNVDIDETTLPDGVSQTTIFTNVVDGDDDDVVTDDGDLGNKDHSGDGYSITLDLGEENLTADFGYNYNPTDDVNNPMGSPVAALGDRIWIDSDGDGVQDPNEIGVVGVEVTLTTPGTDGILGTADDMMLMDTTDENGNYLFDNLPPGAYSVEVTDDDNASHDILNDTNYDQTGDPDHFGTSEADNPNDATEDNDKTDNAVVLGPGDVFLNVDFGYQPEAGTMLGSIGNTIWLDADADGNGPADADPIGSDGDNGLGIEDDNNEQPIEGVSVSLIADLNGSGVWDVGEPIVATDVTDENGNYLFEDLPLDDNGGDMDADYIIWVNDTDNVLDGLKPTFDEDGGTNTPATGLNDNTDMVGGMSSVALSAGTPDDRDQDFGYTPEEQDAGEGAIGDYVWYDTNMDGVQDGEEAGIEGVTVYLYDLGADEMVGGGDDTLIDSTFTDENGGYLFGGLLVDGDGEGYQVQIAPSNFDMGEPLEGLANTFDPDDMTTNPDSQGGAVSLSTAIPVNLDQDFGYVGDDNEGAITLGSVGNQVWEDTNADGIYEPNGVDGIMGTADDETPIEGVTIDLYRDLDGNGEIDPEEPRIGTTTTDANGMYLFDDLPLDDYVVDVTDVDGVLAGYWHSTGNQDPSTNMGNDPMDNSKEDAFAVTIDNTTPDNLNVDFGYYKEPAAVGNYVWRDSNANGLQDDGETGINDAVVSMEITYPDGTTVTLTDTTMNDASGNPGFYEFPNLLLDEDYVLGAGTGNDGEDPNGVMAAGTTPKYVISVDANQMVFTSMNLSPTMADVTTATKDTLNDSENFAGVVAIPTQGSENTAAVDPSTNETGEAKYDFGAAPQLDLATNIMISSMTPAQGYYDEDDPIEFMVNVFNQGAVPVSDVTITNYLPSELENAVLVANSLMINGMPAPMGVSIVKMGNDYVIDFGTDPNNWFDPMDELTFKYTADITDGTTPGTEITNTIEISSYDTDNNGGTAPPADIDSVADSNNGGDGEAPGSGLEDDVTDEDANNNVGDDSDDHDIVIVPSGQVLPVELLGFEAKADKDHIDLVWITASEFNNSHFELERSEDGKVFKQIARIQGQGTTLEQADYGYEDQEVIPGVLYYYRLKQVDFDGVSEYSEIRTAKLEALEEGMELYPNPIGDATELQVRFYTTELTKEFVILDIHNRSVLQVKQDLKNTGWNTISIDIQVLPAGTYLILDKEGNSMRFVKARE